MNLDPNTLNERVERARYYRTEKFPGTGVNDAVNAVLSTDFRGKLTPEKERERQAYRRAMKSQLEAA